MILRDAIMIGYRMHPYIPSPNLMDQNLSIIELSTSAKNNKNGIYML
jgi:hypothetical protein